MRTSAAGTAALLAGRHGQRAPTYMAGGGCDELLGPLRRRARQSRQAGHVDGLIWRRRRSRSRPSVVRPRGLGDAGERPARGRVDGRCGACRYDLTNTVLSLGQDRVWRRATRRRWTSSGATRCSTRPPARRCRPRSSPAGGPGALATDFAVGMLKAGKRAPCRRSQATRRGCRSPTPSSTR